ncbi:gliding motility lipoprotein GldD [uncultured Dokdonia sp.]|uniref:gliding motility lipoprotein GldD n=1 Tax=uncultured Dokdonia sp. TaxID=575653 RepID=UPI00261852A4|nr:gliding motility lipoprotein GldD [uncultured Dokdonia sp.]
MTIRSYIYSILCCALLVSCGDDLLPKPEAFLSLEYPNATYVTTPSDCNYSFENNYISTAIFKDNCSVTINYPELNGTLFLTYRKVDNNINALLRDAQKLTYEHVIKADDIIEEKYVNELQDVYGMFYDVRGNAASQSQFYVTDSTAHFITGSIYFNAKPNYDSIYPAAVYLKNDIRHLMETITWNSED